MAMNYLSDGTYDGILTISEGVSAGNPILKLYETTNGNGSTIEFTDQTTQAQFGKLTFYHSDGASQGGGASFWLTSTEVDLVLVVGSDATNRGRIVTDRNTTAEVAYGFRDDHNTGMYSPSNHTLGLVANGTRKFLVTGALVTVEETLNLTDVVNAGTDTDKFLVLDASGNVDFRTGAEVRSDIGAGTGSGTVTSVGIAADNGAGTGITTSGTFTFSGGTNMTTSVSGNTVTINTSATTNTGTVESVTAGAGLTGGTITVTGTIAVDYAGTDNIILQAGNDTASAAPSTAHIMYSDPNDSDIVYYNTISNLPFTNNTGTVTGSGTATRVAFWSSSSALSSDSNLYWNNTSKRLGVGTSAPANLLDVNGDFTLQGNQYMADNNKLVLGTGSDLQIYHDGSNSYIRDLGTSDLYIDSNGSRVGIISDGFASTPMAFFYKDGAVELYHNNSKKLETTSTGATVTGDLIVSGGEITLEGGVKAISNDASNATLVIVDVSLNDSIQGIDLKAFGQTQINITDEEVNINADDFSLSDSTDVHLGNFSQLRLNHASTTGSGGNGFTIALGSSTGLTPGTLYYLTPFTTWIAVANTSSNTTRMLGLATGTSSSSGMLVNGIIRKASHGFTVGQPLYVSSTSGAMTTTVPSGSGTYVRVVGYAVDTDHIYFCPDNTWVEIA